MVWSQIIVLTPQDIFPVSLKQSFLCSIMINSSRICCEFKNLIQRFDPWYAVTRERLWLLRSSLINQLKLLNWLKWLKSHVQSSFQWAFYSFRGRTWWKHHRPFNVPATKLNRKHSLEQEAQPEIRSDIEQIPDRNKPRRLGSSSETQPLHSARL